MALDLRPALELKRPDPERLARLTGIIRQLEDAHEAGAETADLVAEHDSIAAVKASTFNNYAKLYASMSCEEAAKIALTPKPIVHDDITREELIEVARRIYEAEGSDAQINFYLALFEANTLRGNSDIFFWPDQDWLDRIGTNDPSPEQIVDEALRPDD